MSTIKSISIAGFKSIRELQDFSLHDVNVLIGPNGSGKSNFIGFFKFLRELVDERLQLTVQKGGGADAFLFGGPQITRVLSARATFGSNEYRFQLVPTVDGKLVFEKEETAYLAGLYGTSRRTIGTGNTEARLYSRRNDPGVTGPYGVCHYVYEAISSWIVYHFHDTSETAPVRRPGNIFDNETLHSDGGNLAAFLYRLSETSKDVYRKIVEVVKLAAPFFGDFRLRPMPTNSELIQLEWVQKGSDYLFRPSQLSDGTLRFICLATALMQPNLPSTLLFDEPELGLHPYALSLLGRLLRSASKPHGFPTNQVIVSTQSALLLNEFEPDQVVVVERQDGQSVLKRLKSEDLTEWLDDYSLGELWEKNILQGRPRPESLHVSGVH